MSRKLNIYDTQQWFLQCHKNIFFLMFQKQVMQYVASSELCNTWRVKDVEVTFLIGLDFVG